MFKLKYLERGKLRMGNNKESHWLPSYKISMKRYVPAVLSAFLKFTLAEWC